jgi:hypothetical protein
MLCGLPETDSEEIVKVATPDAFVFAVPMVLAPSLNVTVSPAAGFPAPGDTAATVAVKVTDCPNTDGFAELATVVVVLDLLTVCVTADEVLLPNVFVTPP